MKTLIIMAALVVVPAWLGSFFFCYPIFMAKFQHGCPDWFNKKAIKTDRVICSIASLWGPLSVIAAVIIDPNKDLK